MLPQNLLSTLLFLPLGAAIAILFMPERLARPISIASSFLMVLFSGMLWSYFNPQLMGPQFETTKEWISSPFPVQYHVGIDGMSLCLVLLTSVVTLLAVYASETVGQNRAKLYYGFVMLLTFSLVGVFVSLDLLQFFVLYEFELVPMYFLIAIWGGPNRDYAAMKFLLYTFFGGVLMLAGLLYLFFQVSALGQMNATFDMTNLADYAQMLPVKTQLMCFLGFFLAFIIKLPSFPFHTWLPDAHVEAPTPISMILAGLLLKMGSYGLVRICMGFFPVIFVQYGWLIAALGAWNIVWAAIACLVQKDMKRIIAFSSVSHMGFVLLGLGCLSAAGVNGAIFQMISHGIISAALFFLVGVVYERCHTRQLPEIGGGLARQMPVAFHFWMFAALANLGLPALSGFVAETAVFYGSYTSWVSQAGPHAAFVRPWIWFAATGVILTAGYMLWLLKRLFYGPEQDKWKGHLTDARPLEQALAYAMCAMILAMGVAPSLLTDKYGPVAERFAQNVATRLNISMSDSMRTQ